MTRRRCLRRRARSPCPPPQRSHRRSTADPSILGTGTQLVLSGTVPGGAREIVEIEAKECRGTFFRVFAAVTTSTGGAWRHQGFVNVNTTFRARWKKAVSSTVAVKQRTFRKKGLQLRATIDQANARPCDAPGVSPIVRS